MRTIAYIQAILNQTFTNYIFKPYVADKFGHVRCVFSRIRFEQFAKVRLSMENMKTGSVFPDYLEVETAVVVSA